MTRNEIAAYNSGVADLAAIAGAAVDALRGRLTEAPKRSNFAIGALEGIIEAAGDLMLWPDGGDNPATAPVEPRATSPAAASAA